MAMAQVSPEKAAERLRLNGIEPTPEVLAQFMGDIEALPPEERAREVVRLDLEAAPGGIIPVVPPGTMPTTERLIGGIAGSLLSPVEAVEGLARRAVGADPYAGLAAGARREISQRMPPAAKETGRVISETTSLSDLPALLARAREDPGIAADVLGNVIGSLGMIGAAGRFLRMVPLLSRSPRAAAAAAEGSLAALESIAENVDTPGRSMTDVAKLGVAQFAKTVALSQAGRAIGGAQVEEMLTGGGIPGTVGRRAALQAFGRSVAQEGVEEGVDEASQTILDNIFAREPATEGALGAGVMGAAAGVTMGGAGAAARALAPPEGPAVTSEPTAEDAAPPAPEPAPAPVAAIPGTTAAAEAAVEAEPLALPAPGQRPAAPVEPVVEATAPAQPTQADFLAERLAQERAAAPAQPARTEPLGLPEPSQVQAGPVPRRQPEPRRPSPSRGVPIEQPARREPALLPERAGEALDLDDPRATRRTDSRAMLRLARERANRGAEGTVLDVLEATAAEEFTGREFALMDAVEAVEDAGGEAALELPAAEAADVLNAALTAQPMAGVETEPGLEPAPRPTPANPLKAAADEALNDARVERDPDVKQALINRWEKLDAEYRASLRAEVEAPAAVEAEPEVDQAEADAARAAGQEEVADAGDARIRDEEVAEVEAEAQTAEDAEIDAALREAAATSKKVAASVDTLTQAAERVAPREPAAQRPALGRGLADTMAEPGRGRSSEAVLGALEAEDQRRAAPEPKRPARRRKTRVRFRGEPRTSRELAIRLAERYYMGAVLRDQTAALDNLSAGAVKRGLDSLRKTSESDDRGRIERKVRRLAEDIEHFGVKQELDPKAWYEALEAELKRKMPDYPEDVARDLAEYAENAGLEVELPEPAGKKAAKAGRQAVKAAGHVANAAARIVKPNLSQLGTTSPPFEFRFSPADRAAARRELSQAYDAARAAGQNAADAADTVIRQFIAHLRKAGADVAAAVRSIFRGWPGATGRRLANAAKEHVGSDDWEPPGTTKTREPRQAGAEREAAPQRAPPADVQWVSAEIAEAVPPLAASIRQTIGDAQHFTGPGGLRVDAALLDRPLDLARLFARHLGHMPAWLSANSLQLRFPRANYLQLLTTARRGVAKALNDEAARRRREDPEKTRRAHAKEIEQELLEFTTTEWVRRDEKDAAAHLDGDVLSAWIADPAALAAATQEVYAALHRQADRSRAFADAMEALFRETADADGRNAIDYRRELWDRLYTGGMPAMSGSARVKSAAAAREYAVAHPFDAAVFGPMRAAWRKLWRTLIDRSGEIRRLDKLGRRAQTSIQDVAEAVQAIDFANSEPKIRELFTPIADAARTLGGQRSKIVNEFLIAHRVIQGDPKWVKYPDGQKVEFNRRKLNPGGFTPETAQEKLNQLQRELSPADWAALQQVRDGVAKVNADMLAEQLSAGLITQEAHDLYAQSPAYVPYSVVEYRDPWHQAPNFRERKGHTGAVYHVLPQLAEKRRAVHVAAVRNAAAKAVVQQQQVFRKDGDLKDEVIGAHRISRPKEVVSLTRSGSGRAQWTLDAAYAGQLPGGIDGQAVDWGVIPVAEKGRTEFYAVERAVADALYQYGDPGALTRVGLNLNRLSRSLHLRLNPGWYLWSNRIVDWKRTSQNLGAFLPEGAKPGLRGQRALLRDVFMPGPVADAARLRAVPVLERTAAAGTERKRTALSVLEAMQSAGLLPEEQQIEGQAGVEPGASGLAARAVYRALFDDAAKGAEAQIADMRQAKGLKADIEARTAMGRFASLEEKMKELWGLKTLFEFSNRKIAETEAQSKIAASLAYARARVELDDPRGRTPADDDPRVAQAVRNMPAVIRDRIRTAAGSPNFYQGGTRAAQVGVLLQYSPAALGSLTADARLAFDRRTALGVWLRRSAYMTTGIAAALLAGVDPPDEWPEPIRRWIAAMKRIPRWRRFASDFIPLGETRAGRTVGVVIPTDHTDRIYRAPILAAIDHAMRDQKPRLSTEFHAAIRDLLGNAMPSVSWWIPGSQAVWQLTTGRNYVDPFSGRPVLSEAEREFMGPGAAAWRGLLFAAAQVNLAPNEAAFGTSRYPRPAGESLLEKGLRTPLIGDWAGRLVVATDAGLRETAELGSDAAVAADARAAHSRGDIIAAAVRLADAARREGVAPNYTALARDYFARNPDERITPQKMIGLVTDMLFSADIGRYDPRWLAALRQPDGAAAAAATRALVEDGGVDPRRVCDAVKRMAVLPQVGPTRIAELLTALPAGSCR